MQAGDVEQQCSQVTVGAGAGHLRADPVQNLVHGSTRRGLDLGNNDVEGREPDVRGVHLHEHVEGDILRCRLRQVEVGKVVRRHPLPERSQLIDPLDDFGVAAGSLEPVGCPVVCVGSQEGDRHVATPEDVLGVVTPERIALAVSGPPWLRHHLNGLHALVVWVRLPSHEQGQVVVGSVERAPQGGESLLPVQEMLCDTAIDLWRRHEMPRDERFGLAHVQYEGRAGRQAPEDRLEQADDRRTVPRLMPLEPGQSERAGADQLEPAVDRAVLRLHRSVRHQLTSKTFMTSSP